MEILLNIPSGAKQREFLDYLNAAMRKRMSSFGGSSGQNEDGNFESIVSGQFDTGQNAVLLSWRITILTNGTLDKITVTPDDAHTNDDEWKISAHEFINSVLASAFSAIRQKYFRRCFFFYIGEQLDGEYWLPGFRFAPAYLDDPQPYLINAERIVSIDQEIEAIDDMHANVIASEAARRHASRLSLLMNTALYQTDSAQRWVIPNREDNKELISERMQLGFSNSSINMTAMPKKAEIWGLGKYKGKLDSPYKYAGELTSLPKETRKILRGIDNAAPKTRDAFDRGARLYQVAAQCGRYFPSVGLAYRVAAIEAICKTENSLGNFSDFMRKHVRSYRNIDELLDYLYGSVRSAHFHGGEFPNGEFSRDYLFDPLMDAENSQRDALHRACFWVTREAIVNWVSSLLPEISE